MANVRLGRRRAAERAAEAEIALWGCATDVIGAPIDDGVGGVGGVAAVAAAVEAGRDCTGAGAEYVPCQPVHDEDWQVWRGGGNKRACACCVCVLVLVCVCVY